MFPVTAQCPGGHRWHRKRDYRIYLKLELNLRIKPRRRLTRDKPDSRLCQKRQTWSGPMGLMADRLKDGREFRLRHVLDDVNSEGLGIEVDLSCLPSGSFAA